MKKLNHSIYRIKYIYGRWLKLDKPVDVSLELSSLCNMSCVYCYHGDKANTPFKQKFMSWQTAKKIIHESAEIGVNSLKMNWRGESTLSPHFREVCGLAKSLAHSGTFIERLSNSNFKFPNERKDIFEGLSDQTKVKISYDSFKKDVFENQRAGGDHDLTTKNIDTFYHWPGRQTEIVIQAVRTQANKDEDFESEIKKRWPSASLSVRDVVTGRSEKDYDDLLVKDKVVKRIPCRQAFVRLIFAYDGSCSPCCPNIGMDINLGNVNIQHVGSIYNGFAAWKLREDLKTGKAFEKNPCLNCSSHESYKGYKPNWSS